MRGEPQSRTKSTHSEGLGNLAKPKHHSSSMALQATKTSAETSNGDERRAENQSHFEVLPPGRNDIAETTLARRVPLRHLPALPPNSSPTSQAWEVAEVANVFALWPERTWSRCKKRCQTWASQGSRTSGNEQHYSRSGG